MLTILIALVIFGVMILLHELGHFFAARLCNVRVEEFSIGFGPAIFSRKRGGTLYSVRALPLGGYNLLAQENGPPPAQETDDEETPAGEMEPAPDLAASQPEEPPAPGRNFHEASVWQRIFIIASGAAMNFVLGFVLLLVLQSAQPIVATLMVHDFLPGATSPAAGLQAEDVIRAVNGHRCYVWGDILYELERAGYGPVQLTVLRDGRQLTLKDVQISPATDDEGNQLPIDFHVRGVQPNVVNVLQSAGGNFVYYARVLIRSFADLFSGATGLDQLSGPVGVVGAVSEAVRYGWQDVMGLAVLLTINLGIFNLLPLPGLDGGKLIFLLVEGVTRRKVPTRVEEAATMAGMLLLVVLMLYVTFNDVIQLF